MPHLCMSLQHLGQMFIICLISCDQLSIPNQLCLTLIKLRLHTPNFELSRMFGISNYSESNIFITWIDFMYHLWNELIIFPSRDVTNFFMPDDLVSFLRLV